MRTGSVLFLLGVVLLCRFEELPSSWVSLALGAALLLLITASRRAPAWVICGFLWAWWRADLALDADLDPLLEGRTVMVTGRVASLPVRDEHRTRFDFDVRTLEDGRGRALPRPDRIRLNWYRGAAPVEPGQAWRLAVRLKRPVGFSNPGGFDYESWLFQQRIRATGYVVTGVPAALDARQDVDSLRLRLRDWIRSRFPDRRRGGLLAALAIGDSSEVTAGDWRVLTRTGTSHLLAISGLHIALVAAIGFAMVRRLWPMAGPAPLWLPAPKAASIAAVIAAGAYAALAGFGVPTQRALVMVLAWTVTAGLCRQAAPGFVLAAALLAVLVFDPFAVLAPGFWLSFGAVAVIGFGMGARTSAGGWWRRWGRVHLVVAAGLLPILVWWFHQVPVLTVPANLVAVPWISLLTVPLVLFACLLLPLWPAAADRVLDLAGWSIEWLWPFLRLLADPPFSTLPSPDPGVPAAILGLIGATMLVLPHGVPGRWLGLAWMLPLLVPAVVPLREGEFRLTVLDVGQGLAAVVQTRERVLVYDTGPGLGPEFSAGAAVVLPYLRQAGIGRIDVLMISHGDSDHAGGLSDVLNDVDAPRILAGMPETIPGAAACAAGQHWRWDGVDFEVLHPHGDPAGRKNNRSCVLRVANRTRAALLPGDIEAPAEAELLSTARSQLAAQVVIAPHHGSRTSSSRAFVAAVNPDAVVFATGFGNRFGFPKQDIIARYQQHGARILDTARSGAIDIRFDEAGISIHTHRQQHRRFWHSRI